MVKTLRLTISEYCYLEEDEETREENLKDEDENRDKENESDNPAKKKLHDDGNTSNVDSVLASILSRNRSS